MGSINERTPDYDVLCIGAGLSGIYTTYRLRELGLHGKILEAGSGEGGTWFWNRYPGARFDSESYSYQYFFSKELMQDWNWTEHFSPQPETLKYINHVTDRFDLRKDMIFNTRIAKASYDETSRLWVLTDQNGKERSCRFLITAMGILTNPVMPNIPGVHNYTGEAHHTARWPETPVSFENKRIAIIGTGATGIQTIQEVVKTAGHLTVFQRTANWACPMHNAKISPEEMDAIRNGYPEMMRLCADTHQAFMHDAEYRKTTDLTPEERDAVWEELYNSRGFGIWLSNFADVGMDHKANKLCSDFIANKIRQRVNDPVTAEKLVPKDHGFGTRRVPLETHYYECYNQPNVSLVDCKATPIECITEKGIKTSEEDFEFDMIIYATGFDAITGSFDAVDFEGKGGVTLKQMWKDMPRTYLGFFVEHFPNMMMIMGPHQAFGNNPRSIEFASFWITQFIKWCKENHVTYAECKPEEVEKWTQHVLDVAKGTLMDEVDSWMTGVNPNVPGKQKRYVARYAGSVGGFRGYCNDVRDKNYNTLKLA